MIYFFTYEGTCIIGSPSRREHKVQKCHLSMIGDTNKVTIMVIATVQK